MTVDTARLRALAAAATPGPWRFSDDQDRIIGAQDEYGDPATIVYAIELDGSDAAYIAAANPQTILALLDALDAERRKVESLGSLVRELAETVHQTGSLRDHADPNDRTGWNVHGIETCEDPLCVDALAAIPSDDSEGEAG